MLSVADLLMASGAASARAFSSIPYAGTGGVTSRFVGVDFDDGGMILLRKLGPTLEEGLWDTVRGVTAKGGFSHNEQLDAAFAFSDKKLVFTGASFNALGSSYVAWSFAKLARFIDIVPFSGGATNVPHSLGETPAMILYFYRGSGTGAIRAGVAIPGQSVAYDIRGLSQVTTGGVVFSADATTFTPGASYMFPGSTWVAVLVGTGLGRIATGSWVGTVPFGTTGSQNVSLPFAPQWGLFFGPAFNTGHDARASVYDPKITGSAPNGAYGPHLLGLSTQEPQLPISISGAALTAVSAAPPGFSPAFSACISGETYHYLLVR